MDSPYLERFPIASDTLISASDSRFLVSSKLLSNVDSVSIFLIESFRICSTLVISFDCRQSMRLLIPLLIFSILLIFLNSLLSESYSPDVKASSSSSFNWKLSKSILSSLLVLPSIILESRSESSFHSLKILFILFLVAESPPK